MKNLINDLNLASKLEYNMQPINPKKQNLIAVIRQVVVDFINMNIDILQRNVFIVVCFVGFISIIYAIIRKPKDDNNAAE